MSWRNLIIATAFLATVGMAYAQEPAHAVNDTGSADVASGPVVNRAPLGGIERRDVSEAGAGTLHYTISAAQSFESGSVPSLVPRDNGTPEYSTVSGTIGYLSSSSRNLFATSYSGGGTWSSHGTVTNTNFDNFEVRDSISVRRLTLMMSDNVGYMPQSPTVGVSGIPGQGDLNGIVGFGALSPTIIPNQTILSVNSQRISNTTAGSATLDLTGRTAVTAMGSYGFIRFPDTGGLDTNQEMAGLTVNHQFSARNTLGVKYAFMDFSYNSGIPVTINTHEVSLLYERLWSRRWKTDFEVGPQWVETLETPSVPAQLNVAGNASVTYNLTNVSLVDLRYMRGVSGGSGVLQSSRVDSVSLAARRSLGRSWSASVSGTYSRNVGLTQDELFTTKYAGAQLTRKFGSSFSGYFSYTVFDQSSSGAAAFAPISVVQGMYHVFSFGIQFTSRPIRTRGV